MRCTTAQSHLSAWHDGQLRRDLMLRVEEHLEGCADCRQERELLRLADRAAREVLPPEEPISPTFIGDLERRIAREGDAPAAAGAGPVPRALIPMAAAVLLGATLTLGAVQLFDLGAPEPGADGVASEYDSFADSSRRFATSADLVLSNMEDIGSADPAQELVSLRHEAQAAGVRPAMADVARRIPEIQNRDGRLAVRLQTAVRGMQTVLASLDGPGNPDEKLLEARERAKRLRVLYHVRSLVPEGLPRPVRMRATARVRVQAPNAADPSSAELLAGVQSYTHGDLERARAHFEAAMRAAQAADRRARAAYWASRCDALANKPKRAAQMVKAINAWRPDTAAKVLRIFAETGDGGSMTLEIGKDGALKIEQNGKAKVELDLRDPVKVLEGVFQDELKQELRDLERELRGQSRRWAEAFQMRVVPVEEVLAVSADGSTIELANARHFRQVLPVMLGKFMERGVAKVELAKDGRTATMEIRTEGLIFSSWEARRFVDGIGGAAATKLRGAESQQRSELKTLTLKLRVPQSAKGWSSFRFGWSEARPPAPPAPPEAPRRPDRTSRHSGK